MNQYFKGIEKHLTYIDRPEFEYDIHISLKYRYVYIETPKVGCSTIKDTLHRMELDYPELVRDDFEDIHRRGMSPLLTPAQTCNFERIINNNDYFKFCFVRNPYARLLSAYFDKIAKPSKTKSVLLSAINEDPDNLSKIIEFKDFVKIVCDMKIRDMDPHWRPQYHQTFQDTINYDFIGRMETFNEDCIKVFSRLRPDYLDYYHSVRSHKTDSNSRLKEFYSNSTIELVKNKYKVDFEYFDYTEDIIT